MRKLIIILFSIIAFAANAQKLPSTQQISFRAPAGVKIDGKATEWGTFQAYNHSCDIYYTIANDDDNLYLTIQSTYPDVISRILNGGITFTVSTSGKKGDKGGQSVTYPVFSTPLATNLRNTDGGRLNDSLMAVYNKKMNEQWKTIKTRDIKDLDSTVSMYNDEGLKARGSFDNKLALTCELSITLKHLGLDSGSPAKFAYHIVVNEVIGRGIDIKKDDDGKILSINVSKGAMMASPATDFWGEYTLAKK